jgi:hypothetical protein
MRLIKSRLQWLASGFAWRMRSRDEKKKARKKTFVAYKNIQQVVSLFIFTFFSSVIIINSSKVIFMVHADIVSYKKGKTFCFFVHKQK